MSKDYIFVSSDGVPLDTVCQGSTPDFEDDLYPAGRPITGKDYQVCPSSGEDKSSESEENYDDLDGLGDSRYRSRPSCDNRPILEPGNMWGYLDFNMYYCAVVIRPLIHEKEVVFVKILDQIKRIHFDRLSNSDSVEKLEIMHRALVSEALSALRNFVLIDIG